MPFMGAERAGKRKRSHRHIPLVGRSHAKTGIKRTSGKCVRRAVRRTIRHYTDADERLGHYREIKEHARILHTRQATFGTGRMHPDGFQRLALSV